MTLDHDVLVMYILFRGHVKNNSLTWSCCCGHIYCIKTAMKFASISSNVCAQKQVKTIFCFTGSASSPLNISQDVPQVKLMTGPDVLSVSGYVIG